MNIMNVVKAIVILHIDGKKLLARYFDDKINTKQFEKNLFAKTKTPKAKDEIIVLDGYLVVHKFETDSHYYVVGARNENPMILDKVLECIVEVASLLASNNSSASGQNIVLDNLPRIIMALDEICDGGLILEVDSNLVYQRVSMAIEEVGMESMAPKPLRKLFGLNL